MSRSVNHGDAEARRKRRMLLEPVQQACAKFLWRRIDRSAMVRPGNKPEHDVITRPLVNAK